MSSSCFSKKLILTHMLDIVPYTSKENFGWYVSKIPIILKVSGGNRTGKCTEYLESFHLFKCLLNTYYTPALL